MLSNKRGTALIMTVVLMVVVASIGTVWLSISAANTKEAGSRENKLMSHYLADTGIQIALAAMISDSPPSIPFKQGESDFTGGTYTVTVRDIGNNFFQINGYGTHDGVDSQIEKIVKKTQPDFDLEAAFAVQLNPNAEVESDTGFINIDIDGANGKITGKDHDLAGKLMADQSAATYAAALNTLIHEATQGKAGVTDFLFEVLDEATQVVGTPTASANDRPFMGDAIDMMVDYVRNKPDLAIDLTKKASVVYTKNDGSFGTPDDYKTIYVNAGTEGGGITFSSQFEGYGLLVIEAEEGETVNFQMGGQASWNGLIIYKMGDDYIATKGNAMDLVGGGSPTMSPHILGGAIFYASGNKVQLGTKAYPLRIRGQSRVYFCSEAVKLALQAASSYSYDTVSYRVVK